MQNQEQIRAANALRAANEPNKKFSGKDEGELVKKVPAMILNHGFLATAAFGFANNGYKDVFDAIAQHLADERVGCLPPDKGSFEKMIHYLTRTEASSVELRQVTSEAMAWLTYARRFIQKGS